MKNNATAVRAVQERTAAPDIKVLARQPGIRAVHRITAYYADGRARHSVATLFSAHLQEDPTLEVVYEGLFDHRPLRYDVDTSAYMDYCAALSKAGFDTLGDQPDPNFESMTLWLVERVAGSFYHSIIILPHQVLKPYTLIVNAIDAYLPEAIREIKR